MAQTVMAQNMTLRDFFAGMAMTAVLTKGGLSFDTPTQAAIQAKQFYVIADALLVAGGYK